MKKATQFFNKCLFTAIFLVFSWIVSLPLAAKTVKCNVNPRIIEINFGYHGAVVNITGSVPGFDDLVVKISSPPQDNVLKYKGKAGGFLWMKKGSLKFKGLPPVYFLYTSGELSKILKDKDKEKYLLGYDKVLKKADVVDSNGNRVNRKWLKEFIELKKEEKLYSINEGAIKLEKRGEGKYSLKVDWPFQALPGTYRVEVFAIQKGEIKESVSSKIEVRREGVVAFLSKMAIEKSSLYGLMAVAVALFAGLFVGVIFKKGGDGSH